MMETPHGLGNRTLLLYCLSGSRAYGLDTPSSDTDHKGIYLMPKTGFFGLQYEPQLSLDNHNQMYYELGRAIELLLKNNPTLLELIATPADATLYRHPALEKLTPENFLSKLCEHSFAGYAHSQLKKARGLNKKIVNPLEQRRKSILEFCHVLEGAGSVPLPQWLAQEQISQTECGLVKLPHMRELFAVFYVPGNPHGFKGIAHADTSNGVLLSSIPKGLQPVAYLAFNQDGYSAYCRDYRQYWEWVENRNDVRYNATLAHGQQYDAKNLMHTFRLLNMAEEIAKEGQIIVRRSDRDELFRIRNGEFTYDELVARAEDQFARIREAFAACPLPEEPDAAVAEAALVAIREFFYS